MVCKINSKVVIKDKKAVCYIWTWQKKQDKKGISTNSYVECIEKVNLLKPIAISSRRCYSVRIAQFDSSKV